MSSPVSSFDYLTLSSSTPVVIYADATKRDPIFGFICRVKNNGVNCLAIYDSGGIGVFHDCWHIDDPRIQAKPEIYRELAEADDRGIFEFAPSEKARLDMLALIHSLPLQRIKEIAASYSDLAATLKASAEVVQELQKTVEQQGRTIESLNTRLRELGSGRKGSA